jgi:gamma-aminobutyric acid type B receptor
MALLVGAVLCFLLHLQIPVACSEISLVPTPALGNAISQCGCDNGALQVLTPASGQALPEILLTGFFSMDRDGTCSESQPSLTNGHLLPAAFLALDEINNSSDILPGYYLALDVRDSRCDSVHATTEFIDTVRDRVQGNSPPNSLHLGMLGPGCSATVVDTLAGTVSRSLKFPVVSYALISHPLSERDREDKVSSVLFHMSRSLLFTTQSAIGLMRWLGWDNNTAFISEEGNNFFLSTIESVVNVSSESSADSTFLSDGRNGSVQVSQFIELEVKDDGLALPSKVDTFFQNVRNKHIRVILAIVSQKIAVQLICTGKMGVIPGDGFLYVFIGSFSNSWWRTETNSCELTDIDVESVIIVSGNLINPDIDAVLKSGMTVHDFKVQFLQNQKMWCNNTMDSIDPSTGSVYDAVWTLALALNENTDLIDMALQENLQYDPITLGAVIDSLGSLNFTGVTGQVEFIGGDRIGAESIQQIQDGHQVVVGLFEDGKLVLIPPENFVWNGSSNSTPSGDLHRDPKGVDIYWLVIFLLITVSGIIVALVMCGCNCYYSRHKILLASSQKLNYVIIIGVIFGYLTVLMLTLLESPLGTQMDDEIFKLVCLIRIWTLPLSFTLTYGILFARAWRIYRVFNNPWIASRPLKDYHLMLMVLGIAFIDVLILIPWTVIDPYRRFRSYTEVDYDSFSVCVFSSCSSDNSTIWLLVLAIYKIAIIMGGIFVISLVRKEVIERKIFDDSRSLAVAVYTTALAFIIGLPLTLLFLLADQIILAYIVSAAWVNVSSWATQLTVFMPKFYKIVIKKDDGNSYRRARKLYYGREFSMLASASYARSGVHHARTFKSTTSLAIGEVIEGTDV